MALLRRIFASLDPSSSLTTDVKFLFKGESGIVREVRAHKLILGGASDVFEREFFGPMQKYEDIEIKDVSEEVFRAMIDYIYNKKIELTDFDLDFLSSLYYIADLYNIEELRLDIIASIPEHDVSDQNLLDVAILAENNILYQRLSEALYDSAAVFMKKKFGGKMDNVVNFCSEADASGIQGQVIVKMIGRMKSLPNPTTNPKCENCEQEQPSCFNGHVLTRENFVPGAKVTPTSGYGIIYTSVLCHDQNRGSFKNMNGGGFVYSLSSLKYKCIFY